MGLASPKVSRAAIFEGQDLTTKARLVSDDGTRISTDGGSSTKVAGTNTTFKIYDLDSATPATAVNTTTTVANTTVLTAGATAYITDGWDKDNVGYNWAHIIADAGPVTWKGGHRYRIDYTLDYTSTIAPGAQAEGDLKWSVYVTVKVGH